MDNDTLINQARNLYAALQVKKFRLSMLNKTRFDRLDRVIMCAYCRYQRRLNRCVLCYQHRLRDCNREVGKNHSPCARRNPFRRTTAGRR